MKNRVKISWLLVYFLTQLVTLVVITLLFTLGLILPELILYPMALTVTALLSTVTAVWASNHLSGSSQETSPTDVVVRSVALAVVLSILLSVGAPLNWLPSPPIVVSSLAGVIMAVTAVYFTVQLRQPADSFKAGSHRYLLWLAAALLIPPIVIFLASLLGWAGA